MRIVSMIQNVSMVRSSVYSTWYPGKKLREMERERKRERERERVTSLFLPLVTRKHTVPYLFVPCELH